MVTEMEQAVVVVKKLVPLKKSVSNHRMRLPKHYVQILCFLMKLQRKKSARDSARRDADDLYLIARMGACCCYQGFPLGFAKATKGTLKNHYPKGLRTQY